jgi:hypothetical protein
MSPLILSPILVIRRGKAFEYILWPEERLLPTAGETKIPLRVHLRGFMRFATYAATEL